MTPKIVKRNHERVRRHKLSSSSMVGMNRSNAPRKPHGGC